VRVLAGRWVAESRLVCPRFRRYFSNMSTVQEIKAAIDKLSADERIELEYLLLDSRPALDPEVDSPELEAELLKAADGPFTPFSIEEMREECERIIRSKRGK
jgi:hypothetical protein